jgi:hypothetical protein
LGEKLGDHFRAAKIIAAVGEAVSDRAITIQLSALQGAARCDLRQRATKSWSAKIQKYIL